MTTNKLFAFMFLFLFAIALVSSAPPTTTVTDYQRGVDIIHPETIFVDANEDLEFNFWTYNSTNGATLTNASLNCTLYLINSQGINYFRFSNQAGASGLITYGKGAPLCINCWTMTLPKENISVGMYSYQIKCQGNDIGGYDTGQFEVTNNGRPSPVENLLVMFILLFFIVAGIAIFSFMYVLNKFSELNITLNQILLSYSSFGIYLMYYYFANYYWANAFIMDLLLSFLWVCGFMNLFIVSVVGLLSLVKQFGEQA